MNNKIWKNKKIGGYLGLANLVLIVITLIFYVAFSNVADCFRIEVVSCLLIAAIFEGVCTVNMIGILPIISCMCLSAAEVLFVKSILSSLVNYFSGVTMFGGTNQYNQIFMIIGMIAVTLLVECVSCFAPRTIEEI